jgi:hypothetical protein
LIFVPNFFVAKKPIVGLHGYIVFLFYVVFYYAYFSQIIETRSNAHVIQLVHLILDQFGLVSSNGGRKQQRTGGRDPLLAGRRSR